MSEDLAALSELAAAGVEVDGEIQVAKSSAPTLVTALRPLRRGPRTPLLSFHRAFIARRL